MMRALIGAYSTVVFATRPLVGALVAAATFLDPGHGLAGLVAVIAATLVARSLGYRVDAIRHGHYGFNALLVGLAAAAHHPFDARLVALVALAGVAAALLTAVLGDLFHRGAALPVLALPFVLLASALAPTLDALPAASPGVLDRPLIELALALPPVVDEVLRSFGSIVFDATPLAGMLVLAALLCYSRIATALALGGILAAYAMASVLGVSGPSVIAMTYNGALVSLAIGAVFFVPGRASLAAGLGAALLAAWLTVGAGVLLGRIGLTVLAWPFVLVTLATLRGLHLRAPDRAPFASPLPGMTPEHNLAYAAARTERFGIPGPPQLVAPFYGTWTVTQGVDGAHTHQGAWAYALDFEVVDADGFPFRDRGEQVDDYACFGLPVLAPASGTVAAVFDGAPDSPPGSQDTERPWGNAIVIHCEADLYVVVAHLKRGSVAVAPGQWVVAGQPIAACGSSGRSPRPHLHLQMQRSAELGAAAIPFTLVHYIVEEGEARRYIHVGLPSEGQRVAPPTPSPIAEAFAALPPGEEIDLSCDDGSRVRLVSEISLLGERSLRDIDRGDRLYFTVIHGNLTFTAHTGPASAPLRALLLALPRLPSVAGAATFTDRPPPAALMSMPARIVHDVVRVVGDPIESRAEVTLEERPGELVISTTSAIGLRGHTRCHTRSRVELDAAGLRTLEVLDADGAVRLRARRAA